MHISAAVEKSRFLEGNKYKTLMVILRS